MCGRFGFDLPPRSLADHFGLPLEAFAGAYGNGERDVPGLAYPSVNIAPGSRVLAMRRQGGGYGVFAPRWGLVPFWAKDVKIGYKLFNARSETVHEKPAFRAAYRHRRCLIPADRFYEFTGAKGGRQPVAFSLADGSLFSLAGLWEVWESAQTGEVLESCTILTTSPNPLVAEVHERMPVILDPADYGTWLDEAADPRRLASLLVPFPAQGMTAREADKRLASPRYQPERS